MIQIDNELIHALFSKAKESDRKRMNYDLRTSSNDGSQRMLNALLPGTEVAIHKHPYSSESIICVCGRMDVILLDEKKERVQLANAPEKGMDALDVISRKVLVESERIMLFPKEGNFGCVVPKDTWHTVKVYEPSAIFEAKDGQYGEDGSCLWHAT